jgi:predicted CXXCH cytochrome family protein
LRKRKAIALGLCGAALVFVVLSCSTLDKPVMLPPNIPGATFIGASECATCHEKITRFFPTATHARLLARGTNAVDIGCESCHGPGSKHSQSGGQAKTIINPGRSPQVCFQCHLDKRGQFSLPYHHAVLEGRVSCTDCHEPHKGPALLAGGTALLSEKDVCSKCHVAQLGPYVFEHEAVREGCTSCHAVHGSVNAKLLKERNANLCLKCHFQRQTTSGKLFIGDVEHSRFLSRGTCWSAGCHEAIHGSQVSQSLRF